MNTMKRLFGLTDNGARGLVKASISSLFLYVAYMSPILLVLLFLENLLEGRSSSLLLFSLGILFLFCLMYIVIYYNYNTLYTETYKESSNLRIEIANILKALPLSYFSKHNTSDLSQTIMKDVADIEHAMSHAIPQSIGFFLYLIVLGFLMLWNNIVLGLCVLLPILVSFSLLLFSKKIQLQANEKYYHILRDNAEAFQEAIELQQEIKSYGKKEKYQKDLMRRMEESEKIHVKSEIYQAIPNTLASSILRMTLGITVFAGTSLYFSGGISLLYFLGYLIAASQIVEGVNGLYLNIAEIMYIDARIQRIRSLREVEIQSGQTVSLKNYDIELRDLEFSYQKGVKIIAGVSFLAKQNEVTALVGPSGCGKTSLLKLIARLYDYDAGSVCIGGKEIHRIETESLFEKISIVFQEVMLFNTTVMENIRIGNRQASDEEVKQAAVLANCHEFIEKLPKGYHTMIGENGNQLSGGERQRLSIARAFLKDAPIILLDEVVASLDIENEMKIQESLSKLIQGKTVLVISHRLKSIEKADQIVVLNKGRIEGIGKHEELIKSCELYQRMIQKSKAAAEYQY